MIRSRSHGSQLVIFLILILLALLKVEHSMGGLQENPPEHSRILHLSPVNGNPGEWKFAFLGYSGKVDTNKLKAALP